MKRALITTAVVGAGLVGTLIIIGWAVAIVALGPSVGGKQ